MDQIDRMFVRPDGAPGELGADLMERHGHAMALEAIARLGLKANDEVIEIGFGPGFALEALARVGKGDALSLCASPPPLGGTRAGLTDLFTQADWTDVALTGSAAGFTVIGRNPRDDQHATNEYVGAHRTHTAHAHIELRRCHGLVRGVSALAGVTHCFAPSPRRRPSDTAYGAARAVNMGSAEASPPLGNTMGLYVMVKHPPPESGETDLSLSWPSVTFGRPSGNWVIALLMASPCSASCRLKSNSAEPEATRWRSSSMRKLAPFSLASSSLRPRVPPTGSKIHLPNCFFPQASTNAKA